DAVARFNRNTTTGAIAQPAGNAGCISETGSGACADGHGLSGPFSLAVSPDGKSIYAVSRDSDAVARFNRNTTTGPLTPPPGPDASVASGASCHHGAVARFNRNTTIGAIAQPAGTAGCISETGSGPCADGHGLSGAAWVAVCPNGKSVYVASNTGNAVARLN